MEVNKKLSQILVVDDDINQSNMISDLLTSLGYSVSVAFSPKEAEYMIRRQPINIVLIDCLMPEIDGYTLAKRIYEQFGSSVSTMLMSSIFKISGLELAKIPNMHTLLRKPIDEQTLDIEVKNVLNKMFYEKSDVHIYSLVSQNVVPTQKLQQQISDLKVLHEGDVFLMLSYLFRSKSEGVLHLSDSHLSIKVSFFNGFIVQFTDSIGKSEIINYISKNKLLSKSEIEYVAKLKDSHLEYLIEQGFMSPHQLIIYNIERLIFCLTYFAKQKDVKVQFNPLNKKPIKGTIQTNSVSNGRIQFSQLMDLLTSFILSELSDEYLKMYLDQIGKKELNLQPLCEVSLESYPSPVLKAVFKKRDIWKDVRCLEDLYEYVKDTDQFRRALFLALFHGLIKIQDENVEKKLLEKHYYYRYSKMLALMKDMKVLKVFEFLGCTNTSDFQKLKSIYQAFLKFNHSDKFSQFSSSLKSVVQKVNQIVIQAYDILSNKNSMEKYNQEMKSMDSQKLIEYNTVQNELKDFILMKQFDQTSEILEKMSVITSDNSRLQPEFSLWKVIVEVKKDNFELSEDAKANVSSVLSKLDMYGDCLYLFYYAEGLFHICKSDFDTAQKCFDQSLLQNSEFHLAKIESMGLKKLIQKFGKTQNFMSQVFKKSS